MTILPYIFCSAAIFGVSLPAVPVCCSGLEPALSPDPARDAGDAGHKPRLTKATSFRYTIRSQCARTEITTAWPLQMAHDLCDAL